jgi:hypothetical protein
LRFNEDAKGLADVDALVLTRCSGE